MGAADATIFALLAIADIMLLVLLRWKHGRRQRIDRMNSSLGYYLRRELARGCPPARRVLRRAS